MIRQMVRAGFLALAAMATMTAATSDAAVAATPFDGQWNLTFYTRRGACDASYNFEIYIRNGVLLHPNLVRFRGRVDRSGRVRASVAVEDRYANGFGRMTTTSGRGSWSGYGEGSRCSGSWVARRF